MKAASGNPKNYAAVIASIETQVASLLAAKKTQKCLWVLPPAAASNSYKPNKLKYAYSVPAPIQADLNQALKKAVLKAGCLFHDSTQDIPTFNDLNDDGFHFYSDNGFKRAKTWAASACDTLKKNSDPTEMYNESLLKQKQSHDKK
jgi:hypothetical protein